MKRAKSLRRDLTPPEAMLWSRLRRRGEGLVFRRQHPLGPFILDFYCPAAKLVIEIDGIGHSHGDQPERDERRDGWLTGQGLQVLRIAAADVFRDADEVADNLWCTAVGLTGR
jgi:very-short-patch-repair endonuclease